MTVSLLAAVPFSLRLAGTWNEKMIWLTDRQAIQNYLAPMGLTSLAVLCIGLITTWTGFRKGLRSSWLILFVIASLFYFPVLVRDLDWSNVFENLRSSSYGSTFARESFLHMVGFVCMLMALVLSAVSMIWKFKMNSRELRSSEIAVDPSEADSKLQHGGAQERKTP
jgi:hypothetical protein